MGLTEAARRLSISAKTLANWVSAAKHGKPVTELEAENSQLKRALAEMKMECDLLKNGEGVLPHEFGVFVRSEAELERAQSAVEAAGLPFKILDEHVETLNGHVSISTLHLAKGLEFRAVVVMACDDEIVPLQERIETVGDDTDLQEVYDTERHLLYVACTRARDHLLVTSVAPASEFLDDMRGGVNPVKVTTESEMSTTST